MAGTHYQVHHHPIVGVRLVLETVRLMLADGLITIIAVNPIISITAEVARSATDLM